MVHSHCAQPMMWISELSRGPRRSMCPSHAQHSLCEQLRMRPSPRCWSRFDPRGELFLEALHLPTEVEERRRTRTFDASRPHISQAAKCVKPVWGKPYQRLPAQCAARTLVTRHANARNILTFKITVAIGDNLSFGLHLWLAVLDLLPVTLS